MTAAAPRALVLSIGSELLVGETVDTNAAFLGAELARLGLDLVGVRQLPDNRDVIAEAFVQARGAADLVLATGGLGPTHDDLTREGLADALGEELLPDPAIEAMLRERFAAFGSMPVSNLRQALRTPSVEILPNPIGSAPGWWVDRDRSVTALLPGVPSEMRLMFAEQLAPRLRSRFALRPLHVRTVKTFGIGESAAAELVGDLLESPGEGVSAGIYARDDGVHLRFSTRDDSSLLDEDTSRALAALGDQVWGTDDAELAAVALAALGRAGVATLASRETGTGGTLLALLAGAEPVAGAAHFTGGLLDAAGGAVPTADAVDADAVVRLSLLPIDGHGRSRVRVAVSGLVTIAPTELRIHGSGPQRLRRAAFAALDQLRRVSSRASRDPT